MKLVKELPISIAKTGYLSFKSFSSKDLKKKEQVPVIVSLTSIPSRLGSLHLVIKSILDQTKMPSKIIVWLNSDLQQSIPKSLKNLENEYFEIAFSNLNCSHRKLIHTLEKFPNEIIVTVDDDFMYRSNFIELIYQCHLKNPEVILGNHCVNLNYDDKGNVLPYKTWRQNSAINSKVKVPVGAWGILYPPNSLHADVLNVDKFLELTPKADDLWFKAMALKNGTLSLETTVKPKEPIPIANTQKVSLKKVNLGQDLNTKQWNALEKEYSLKRLILE